MKLILLKTLVIIFITFQNATSQNLVPNGSFETFVNCPNFPNYIYYASNWFQPNKYPGINSVNQSSSSDYFNSCNNNSPVSVPNNFIGFQNAKTGNGYIGLSFYTYLGNGNDFREYAEVKLTQELIANTRYTLKYFVNMANFSKFSITKFDAYLSNDSLIYISSNLSWIQVTPQYQYNNRIDDTLSWIEVKSSYIASGGEQFLTIGNFHSGGFCDTIRTTANSINNCCSSYYYIDDVSLEEDTITGVNDINYSNFEISPIPAFSELKIKSNQFYKLIRIMDLYGKIVYKIKQTNFIEIIDVSKLKNGIYFVECEFENGMKQRRKIIVQH